MSDEQNSDPTDPAKSEPFRGIKLDDIDGPIEAACRYLNRAQPARLLVYSFIAIAVAALLAMTASKVSLGGFTPYAFGIFIFLFGTLGTLLPMWAVGRLIADAIKDGVKS